MAKHLFTEIEIEAEPSRIWAVLTDFPAFPQWNPFITSITGEPVVGRQLTARLKPVGGRAMTFTPRLLVAEPGRELRWLGKLFIPHLFDAEHLFQIEPIGPSRSRFVQEEWFTGILMPVLGSTLKGAEEAFGLMNAALKSRVEQAVNG